jgi:hypothetical protein
MEEDRTNLVGTFLEQRINKPTYAKIFKIIHRGLKRLVPKLFRIKKEQTETFQNFFKAKRSKLRCSKTFQKQKGTNRGVPKISGAKRNRKVFQSFLGPKKSKWICPKNLQIKGKQTG